MVRISGSTVATAASRQFATKIGQIIVPVFALIQQGGDGLASLGRSFNDCRDLGQQGGLSLGPLNRRLPATASTAHTGGKALFRYDAEQTDVAGAGHVSSPPHSSVE